MIYNCLIHGTINGNHCPYCQPFNYPHYQGLGHYSPPQRQQGCVCPPTSEQTCGNPICPRKPLPTGLGAQGMSAGTAKTPKVVEGEARQPGPERMRPNDID